MAGRKPRHTSRPRREMPKWIKDTDAQEAWNGRFTAALQHHAALDAAVAAILASTMLRMVATKVHSYVDKGFTLQAWGERKTRGATYKKQLMTAITGLKAAIDLYEEHGDREVQQSLVSALLCLSGQLGRVKNAFGTKRHGRDRDHTILYELWNFLERNLRQEVTFSTLATLINAGFEADEQPASRLVTEENVRKNLTNFRTNNPTLCSLVNSRHLGQAEPAGNKTAE